MSNTRLISGRVLKKTGNDLEQSRYQFLDLASAEPDLGTPNFDGAMLISDADGTRYWTDEIRIDLTGNIAVGTISNTDGSSAIRMTDNVLMEDNLVVNGLTTAPDLFTSRISSPDSSAITVTPAVILNSDLSVDGDAVITGNFTVMGTTTTINSTQLSVEDKNIELANGAGTAAEADGAGITVNGPAVAASLIYTASDDTWNFNKTLKSNVVGDVTGQVSDITNHSIGQLSDVDLAISPLDNQTLVWDAELTKFVPGDSFSQADFDTAFGSKSIGDISDVDITTVAPTDGQTLIWNSSDSKFIPGRSLGVADNVEFSSITADIFTNSIDSADSTEITFIPAVRMSSDLTVENDLTVSNEVSAEKFVGYLDGTARDIDNTSITNKQFAVELDGASDQIFVYDASAGELKKTYLSSIVSIGTNGYTGSQGDIGYTGSQGDTGFVGSQGDIGYTGSQGDIGYTGSQGDQGSSVRLVGSLADQSLLPVPYSGDIGDGYLLEDTGHLWIWNGQQWNDIGKLAGDVGPTGFTGSQGDTGYTGSEGYTGSVGESTFTWGATPPENPDIGARWYDTITGCMTVYVDDGDSEQWVEVNATGFLGQTGYTGSSGGVNAVTTFPTAINSDVTIAVGENGLSVGPLTQASGTVITIAAGQRWIIL